MLRLSILGSSDDLESLRDDWTDLLSDCDAATAFTTWEWASAWWKSYGDGKELRILRIGDDERLLAIVPLYRRRFRNFGVRFTGAFLIGDGSGDSDYLDAIVRRGAETVVSKALVESLVDGTLECDLLFLSEVLTTSRVLACMRNACDKSPPFWQEVEVACTYVDLPESWDAYLKALAPRMRTKVRSLARELEQKHRVRYELCDGPHDLEPRLDDLFRLHALRWEGKRQKGVFGGAARRRFYVELSKAFQSRGWLRLYSLAVDDRYVAHQFCFQYGHIMFLLQEGFDPAWEKNGVGNVLRAHVMRDCIERKVTSYDFLAGVTAHKMSWGGKVKTTIRGVAGRSSLRNRLYFALPPLIETGKNALRAVVPESVLAWRRSLRSQ